MFVLLDFENGDRSRGSPLLSPVLFLFLSGNQKQRVWHSYVTNSVFIGVHSNFLLKFREFACQSSLDGRYITRFVTILF